MQDVTAWLDEALNRWHLMRPEASYRFQRLRPGHGAAPGAAAGPDPGVAESVEQCRRCLPRGLAGDAGLGCQDDLTISIRDHGAGVPLAIAEQIGKPFFTTKGKGFGLGLFLSKASVTRAGGSVKPTVMRKVARLPSCACPGVARGDQHE